MSGHGHGTASWQLPEDLAAETTTHTGVHRVHMAPEHAEDQSDTRLFQIATLTRDEDLHRIAVGGHCHSALRLKLEVDLWWMLGEGEWVLS